MAAAGNPRRHVSTKASALARNYGKLLTSPAFLGFAIGGGCATTSMYAFIGVSPFIFAHQLHRPDYEIGLYPAILVAGIWLGSMAATRLIPRLPIDELAVWANVVSVSAALFFLGAVLSQHLTVLLAIGPMFVFGMGAGIASPAALSQAISVNPQVIGSASGSMDFRRWASARSAPRWSGWEAIPRSPPRSSSRRPA